MTKRTKSNLTVQEWKRDSFKKKKWQVMEEKCDFCFLTYYIAKPMKNIDCVLPEM